jgi:uncharacterized Rmd1/YagE family protein
MTRPNKSPDFVTLGKLPDTERLLARARLLGSRIETRDLVGDSAVSALAGAVGLTFVFRYGVAVTIGAGTEALDRLDEALSAHAADLAQIKETETAILVIRPDKDDRLGSDGQIQLADASTERLLLAATVLACSVLLSRDEILVSETFDHIAPLVSGLSQDGRTQLPISSAMRLVGEVIAARHRVIGTVQADERPDLLWDHPHLDRLYGRLEAEYELKERAEVLERKIAALGDFTEVLLDIIQDKRAFRLEWAIIALIAFEIILSLINMALR